LVVVAEPDLDAGLLEPVADGSFLSRRKVSLSMSRDFSRAASSPDIVSVRPSSARVFFISSKRARAEER